MCLKVGCDESSIVCIEPGYAHSFCWSKYHPLRVKLAMEEWPNQWSDSVLLDSSRNQIVDLHTGGTDGTVHLFISTEDITSIQKLVSSKVMELHVTF